MNQPEHLIAVGDVRRLLPIIPSGSVHCAITSPPYWGLRDYGTGRWEGGEPACDHVRQHYRTNLAASVASTRGGAKKVAETPPLLYQGTCGKCGAIRIDDQIGMEESPEEYIETLVAVFREVRRILRDDGILWLNLGDCYNGYYANQYATGISARNQHARQEVEGGAGIRAKGLKPKDLCLIPERVAIALQEDGWWIRAKPPWLKPNPMPESVEDRPTTAHESIYLLTKGVDYFYDIDATRTPHTMKPQRRPSGRPVDGTPRGSNQSRQTWSTTARDEVAADGHTEGRNRRSADWFLESLDEAIDHQRAYLAHLERIRERGGMLVDEAGETPLGFKVATMPFPGSHFAVFPNRLVEPMIRAGTSAAGCCPACGTCWERETERAKSPFVSKSDRYGPHTFGEHRKIGQAYQNWLDANPPRTLGWHPACRCDAGPPIACTVLDPFSGAATTGSVADSLGRRYVGLELSHAYAAMGARRIARPHAPAERPPAPRSSRGQQTFF